VIGRVAAWRARRERVGSPQTAGALLTRLGRLVLWLAVAAVLVRGLGDILASPRTSPAIPARERTGDVWPDDAARAFAVEFASAYLHQSPKDDPGERARRIAGFASPQLAAELAPRMEAGGPGQTVRSATVAGSTVLDGRHALVTVALTVTVSGGRRVMSRRLVVPVARDQHGGLVVYDLPSLAGPPGRASAGPAGGESLIGSERAEVEAVLLRFLRAYLAGDSAGLSYLVPPGTRIAPAGGLELVELGSITKLAAPAGDELLVLVGVGARDAQARVVYGLRYRVRLVRRDRWYVAEINGPGRGRR